MRGLDQRNKQSTRLVQIFISRRLSEIYFTSDFIDGEKYVQNTPGRTPPQSVNGRMQTLRRKIFFKPDILFYKSLWSLTRIGK